MEASKAEMWCSSWESQYGMGARGIEGGCTSHVARGPVGVGRDDDLVAVALGVLAVGGGGERAGEEDQRAEG